MPKAGLAVAFGIAALWICVSLGGISVSQAPWTLGGQPMVPAHRSLFAKLKPVPWRKHPPQLFARDGVAPLCAHQKRLHTLAYAFYATDDVSAATAAVNIRRLHAFRKRPDADIVVVVLRGAPASVKRRLMQAGATCIAEREIAPSTDPEPTWRLSNLKLHVLGLSDWDRVVYMDADGLIVGNPDHLFEVTLNESYPIAMPRAYWLPNASSLFTSCLIVCHPSTYLFQLAYKAFNTTRMFDMDVLNAAISNRTLPIPSSEAPLIMLLDLDSGSKEPIRSWFNGLRVENVLQITSYIHFSTYPLPKPWLMTGKHLRDIARRPALMYVRKIIDTARLEYGWVWRYS
jgi:hypothetical protein